MTPSDLVWNEVYKGCIEAGCDELIAKDAAAETLEKFKKNQFTKVSKLIQQSIVDAKKLVVNKK